MASSLAPVIVAIEAGGTIAKGKAVKKGSTDQLVVVGAANTDKVVGLAQNLVAVGDTCEVAVAGGAKGLAGETIAMGQFLVSHTDGSLVVANTLGDTIIAQAMKDAVAGDLFDVMLVHAQAAAAG